MNVGDTTPAEFVAGVVMAATIVVAVVIGLAIHITRLQCKNEELRRWLASEDSVSSTQAGALRIIGELTQVARRDP